MVEQFEIDEMAAKEYEKQVEEGTVLGD